MRLWSMAAMSLPSSLPNNMPLRTKLRTADTYSERSVATLPANRPADLYGDAHRAERPVDLLAHSRHGKIIRINETQAFANARDKSRQA